jgi:hypothetical protein
MSELHAIPVIHRTAAIRAATPKTSAALVQDAEWSHWSDRVGALRPVCVPCIKKAANRAALSQMRMNVIYSCRFHNRL